MSLRIRKDGTVLCAALHPEQEGDLYVDDGVHYELSVVSKVLCTRPMPEHLITGEWYWVWNIPEGVEVDPFYLER